MCLPNFIEFKQVEKENPIIGYRNWKNLIKDSNLLLSESREYKWKELEGPHEIKESNSGIYSYNNNYNYYYNLDGIILQYGKVAFHKEGYRSEFAKIDTLFDIRELDAKGSNDFIEWIKIFNNRIKDLSLQYNCKVISWQDFIESQK